MAITHKDLSVDDCIYVVRNNLTGKIIDKYTDGIVVKYDGQEHLEFFQHIQGCYYSLENGKYNLDCERLNSKLSKFVH